LLSHHREYAEVGAAVGRLQPALREIGQMIPAALGGLDRERYLERARRYTRQGLPLRLAESLAALEPLRVAPDLVELMASRRCSARAVARAHFGIGARLGLDWLHGAIEQLPATGSWQLSAQAGLQAAALAAHLRISAAALLPPSRRRAAAGAAGETALERWRQVLRDVRALTAPDLAALTVAVEHLQALAAGLIQNAARLL